MNIQERKLYRDKLEIAYERCRKAATELRYYPSVVPVDTLFRQARDAMNQLADGVYWQRQAILHFERQEPGHYDNHMDSVEWRILRLIERGSKITERTESFMGMSRSFTIGKRARVWYNGDILDKFVRLSYISRDPVAITPTGSLALIVYDLNRS